MLKGNDVQSIHRFKLELEYTSDLGETTTNSYEIQLIFAPNISNAQNFVENEPNIAEIEEEIAPEERVYQELKAKAQQGSEQMQEFIENYRE